MLRSTLLLATIPLANTLSLANFQDITSIFIPLTCQFAYDQQIPDCAVSDFNDNGCSIECEQALTSLASSVAFGCSNVNANSNTLLGIIQDGNILKALCPKLQKTTSSVVQTTVAQTTIAKTTARPGVVTIPTASPGVVVPTTVSPAVGKTTQSRGSATTTKAQESTVQASTSADVSSTVEPSQTITSQTTTLSIASSIATPISSASLDTTISSVVSSTSTSTKTTSSEASSKTATQAQAGSGGGSPFDTASSSVSYSGAGSLLSFCMTACTVVLLWY